MKVPEEDYLRDVIERAMRRELAARRELKPHVQLAIPVDADAATVRDAHRRLRAQYDSAAFAQHGPQVMAVAREISALIESAYLAMREGAAEPLPKLEPGPRSDETWRALETLRGAIARRLAEADRHREAGRFADAARVYESVLLLDRRNEAARQSLREVRAALQARSPSRWRRLLARLRTRARRIEDPPLVRTPDGPGVH